MNFFAAIKRCFGHYATFSGRARRSEYWNWVPFLCNHRCLDWLDSNHWYACDAGTRHPFICSRRTSSA